MDITEKLIEAWRSIEKPKKFVADITSISEAEHELGDVESYFSNKGWGEVDPEADDVGYMCPLLWMNDEAARYYSLSFLVYLASPRALEAINEVPNMAASYFVDSEFSILPKLNELQRNLALKVVTEYERKKNT